MALVRYGFHYNFNYNTALEWTAKLSGTKLYTQTNLPADRAQAYINRDIPRAFIFPKNKFSLDTSHYFYSGWTHINEPFCFIQGDMDGGAFIQLVWQTFALKHDISLINGELYNDLRFGYVGDDKKRRSLALLYYKNDPSIWMMCVTKDTEKVSFDKKHAKIFISPYFCEKFESDCGATRFPEHQTSNLIGKALRSRLLKTKFETFFDAEAKVNIKRISTFEKKELRKMGARYISNEMDEPPVSRHYLFDAIGAGLGGTVGWFAGVFFIGPLLAIPTVGLSLIFAPAVCVLIGAAIGMLINTMLSLCVGRITQPRPMPNEAPVEAVAKEEPPAGGSHTDMAKCGLQGQPDKVIDPVVSTEVEPVESEALKLSSAVPEAIRPTIMSRL